MASSSAAETASAGTAASSAAEFQAVDLDAVLDEFESSQNLEEEVTPPSTSQRMTQESNSSSPETTTSSTPSKMKPNLLEDLKPVSDPPENLNTVLPTMDNVKDHQNDDVPQPDVLSGLENVSIGQHLATSPPSSDVELTHAEPESLMSKSSSSDFESIYDKYKSDDDAVSNNIESSNSTLEPTSSEPAVAAEQPQADAEVTNSDENEIQEAPSEEPGDNSESVNLGARPKEFQTASGAADTVPDLVMDTAFEEEQQKYSSYADDSIPKESPPPYSEVDPLKKERPKTLDIPKEEANETEQETEQNLETTAEGGPPGSTPANPNGPSEAGIPEMLQGLNEDQLMLGKVAPFWVPDSEAPNCMICDAKFTMVRRRHHCRGCGQVLCSLCCNDRLPLNYMDGKEGRVCKPCKNILERLAKAEKDGSLASAGSLESHRPNPANPMDYCSTIPPHQQVASGSTSPPSVVVPVGVLKRPDAASNHSGDPKSVDIEDHPEVKDQENGAVMFSDGIRPGGDLTELDEKTETRRASRRSNSRGHKKSRGKASGRGPIAASDIAKSLLPHEGLPNVCGFGPMENGLLIEKFQAGESVPFALNRNLRVYVKLVHYTPASDYVWNFKTQGMTAVGQDEIVILLIKNGDENLPPRDIFEHLQSMYEQAGVRGQINDMGYSVILSGCKFLDSNDFGGFLFFRHTFQCLDGLDCPSTDPFLFGVLITRWEMPWAQVFPLRLLLRLGAESRYYPTPLWSWRARTTVYKEIGQTIMQVLCDFRNFNYSLPIIKGMVIHMEDKITTVLIPQSSYSQIQKALNMSNTPVLALGGNFSPTADSHLVAVQRDDDEPSKNPMNNSDYETQAINIQNKQRKVTGASFIVLSGALKKSSGLTAKSSIVDDGIMVQISQDRMMAIRKTLNNMDNVKIDCGPIDCNESPDETVLIKWVDSNSYVNAGVKSLIDGSPMDGIVSIRMSTGGTDFTGTDHLIRWTEVFMLPSKTTSRSSVTDSDDPARAAGHLARAICMALTPQLDKLKDADLTPLAVRVNLDPESACYEAGSKGKNLPPEFMNNLDNELVPIIHVQSSTQAAFEFVFHILDL